MRSMANQFVVQLKNTPGAMAILAEALAARGVDLRAIGGGGLGYDATHGAHRAFVQRALQGAVGAPGKAAGVDQAVGHDGVHGQRELDAQLVILFNGHWGAFTGQDAALGTVANPTGPVLRDFPAPARK